MASRKQHQSEASAESLKSAALQIARFRALLDWVLALPAWESNIVSGLQALRVRTKRQGVSQASALRALPIEKKQEIVKHLLATELPRLDFTETTRLARLAGLVLPSANSSFDRLPPKRWADLCGKVTIRVCALYDQFKSAQNLIFAHHYRLPTECCFRVCSHSRLREDAQQEARLGLLEAIDRIDPGSNFEAYSRQWIERRVRNFVMQEQIPVKAPINEISKSFRSDIESNNKLACAIRDGIVQLDSISQETESDPNLTTLPEDLPGELATQGDEQASIQQALHLLTPKQREVIEYRFGLGNNVSEHTLAQIAQRTGISRQQVFQREKRALKKLQELLAPLQKERQDLNPSPA